MTPSILYVHVMNVFDAIVAWQASLGMNRLQISKDENEPSDGIFGEDAALRTRKICRCSQAKLCNWPCGVMVARLTTNQEVVVSSTTSVIFFSPSIVFDLDRISNFALH